MRAEVDVQAVPVSPTRVGPLQRVSLDHPLDRSLRQAVSEVIVSPATRLQSGSCIRRVWLVDTRLALEGDRECLIAVHVGEAGGDKGDATVKR